MSSFFRSVITWVDAHQKGIRTAAIVVGAGCTIATPILAAKATDSVTKKIHASGATTKQEKLKIARKDPWVWATAGATLGSLGCGALSYGLSNRVISKTNEILDKTVDQLDTVKSAVSDLSEEEKDKIDKAVAEKSYSKFSSKEVSKARPTAPIDTGYGDVLFYDSWTNQPFLSSYNKIISVVNELNDSINHGYVKTAADWCILNGIKPTELDYDYYFTNMIELVKDGDHFYTVDDKGAPMGILEFKTDSKPKHLSREEAEGLPFI